VSYAAWKTATDDAGIGMARRRFVAWLDEHVADPTLREDLLILLTRVASTLAGAGVERVLVDVSTEADRIDLRVRSQGGLWPPALVAEVAAAATQAASVLASELDVAVDASGFRTTTAALPAVDVLAAGTERVLVALRGVSAAALAGLPAMEVLAHVAASARVLVDADVATVVLPDDDHVVTAIADGHLAEELEGMREPRLESVAAQIMTTGRTLVVDPEDEYEPGVLVPLWGEGAPIGTLTVGRRRGGRAFDAHDAALLSALATHASLVVQRAEDRHRIEELARVVEREALAEGLREKVITRLFEIGLAVDAVRSRLDGAPGERLAVVSQDIDELVADIRRQIFGP